MEGRRRYCILIRLLRFVRLCFEAFGYACFACILLSIGFIIHDNIRNPYIDNAKFNDIRHVLNWDGIDRSYFEEVVHSYESPFSGLEQDYYNVYLIQLNHIPTSVTKTTSGNVSNSDWRSFPLNNEIFDDAFRLAMIWSNVGWVPDFQTFPPERVRLFFHRIVAYGVKVDSVKVSIIDLQTKKLYYIECSI